MRDLLIGTALLIASAIALTSADKLTALEKRLELAHPWTRVTGWSGTRKGVLAWRGVGILFLISGVIWTFDGVLGLISKR
jgi:hypothetical protein